MAIESLRDYILRSFTCIKCKTVNVFADCEDYIINIGQHPTSLRYPQNTHITFIRDRGPPTGLEDIP